MKLGQIQENIDLSISPKDDFYAYATGNWVKEHPMKPDYSRYGVFDLLRDNSREQLKQLILDLADDPEAKTPGSIAQKIHDLYQMGLDTKRLNEEGAAPIKSLLDKIEGFRKEDFTAYISWLHNGLAGPFFGSGVGVDAKDSDRHIFHLGEAGLGLGDRDYYLEDTERNRQLLEGYEKYVKRIMDLAGFSEEECQRIWETVIKLEKGFAEKKLTREQRRDPSKLYNIFTVSELKTKYPMVDWDLYFQNFNVSPEKVNISNPMFYEYLTDLLPTLTEREIKDYFLYDVVSDATGLLGEEFEDADFEMYDKLMSGIEEKKPRWKIAMVIPNSMFGEAIGELYVKKYFPPQNKEYMLGLVENLRKALAKHISDLTWMSDDTKRKALEKLDALSVKIGYPDKWKDYSEIKIDPALSYWENVYNASKWFIKDNLGKLDKPVDKEEWHMYPQTVNAYYSPLNNEICFPAAILQPPYFDLTSDDAINYGAIGVIIGHEMTHGFDDQGRQFDKNGNLTNWWSTEDEEKFKALSDKLVALFDKVEIAPGVHANGRYTLGENIADQGGLRIALTAYLDTIPEDRDIEGFSPLKRFYLSYGGVWAGSIRDEEKLVRTKSDPHSLEENRVNETLKNIGEFFRAFDIQEGDKMYRPVDERVIIW